MKDVCFIQGRYLLAKSQNVCAVRISDSRREVIAIIDGVDRRKGIFRRKDVIYAGVAKVFAYGLQGTRENFSDAAEVGSICRRSGQRLSSGLTLATAAAREARSGTKAADV